MSGGELNARRLPCWIESYIEATDGLPSPRLFRQWAAISAVAGALERRVYTETAMSVLYANLFVCLVAPPGVGKSQAIEPIPEIQRKTGKLKVAPDDVTKASLLDAVAAAQQAKILSPTDILEYASLQVSAGELGVLLPAHDLAFLNTLNVLYDNKANYRETRRSRETSLDIKGPSLNLLGGTQPEYLASLLPDEAWGMGFMTRIIMVYSGEAIKPSLFGAKKRVELKDLVNDLGVVADLYGSMGWTEAAEQRLVQWYEAGLHPVPQHSKLKHYLPRRILHTLKLCMVSSASRSNALLIEECDVERAINWLIEAEATMPDIFKDMAGQGDAQLIQDLHFYLMQIYMKGGKKPLHKTRILTFLGQRTPAYNVQNVFNLCISMDVIREDKQAGIDLFVPGPRNGGMYE